MKIVLASAVSVSLLMGMHALKPDGPAISPTAKPVAVLSFSGYDEWLGDIEFIGQLADNPDLGKGLEAMLKLVTRSRGLEGLDKTRPWGAVIGTDGDEFGGVVLIPVTDLDRLLRVLEPLVGPAEDVGDGVLKIKNKKGKTQYVKEQKGWAVVAEQRELFAHVPEDPTPLLGDLHQQYDIAVQLHARNVPEKHRKQIFQKIKADAQKDWRQRPGEDQDEYAARLKISKALFERLVTTLRDADQVTVGWSLDHDAQRAFFDVQLTAVPGTETADRLHQMGQAKSNFAGFRLPAAAVSGNWTGRTDAGDVEELSAVFAAIRAKAMRDIQAKKQPAEKEQVEQDFVTGVLDVIEKTVAAGRADGGVSLLLDPDAATMVAGGFVANPQRLEETLKQLAEAARREHPRYVADVLQLDADRYQGVRFHTLSLPIPDDADNRENAVRMFGPDLEVVVGIGDQSAYVAAGRHALGSLKKAIARSADERSAAAPPLQMTLALGRIADFVAEVGKEKDRGNAAQLASLLEDSAGTDRIHLAARPIPRGVQLRVDVEEGILKAIGAAYTSRPDKEVAQTGR